MITYLKTGQCYLCGKRYKNWGNNGSPLCEDPLRVCNFCNKSKVIPARLKLKKQSKEINK